jgi:L,D-transpeptidase YcbB
MKSTRNRRLALVTTALAATMMIGAPQASAQSLFEALFGGGNQLNRHHGRPQPVQPQPEYVEPQRTQPVTLPRVSGPSYYDYRADALVRVDFSAIEVPVEEARAAIHPSGLLVASADGIDADIVSSVERLVIEEDEESVAEVVSSPEDDEVVAAESPETSPSAEELAIVPDVADAVILEVEAAAAEIEKAIQEVQETAAEAPVARPQPVTIETAAPLELPTEVDTVLEEVATEIEQIAEPVEEIVPQPMRLTVSMLEALEAFELLTEKAVSEALIAHYSEHADFIWVVDGAPSDAAAQALDVLAAASSHGLDPDHYRVSAPRRGASEAELARFEMELSARTLRYVRDIHGGRIDPNRISGYHDFQLKEVEFDSELLALARAEDVRAYLNSRHPQNDFYRQLRAELEMLRVAEENDIIIDLQGLIRPGHTNSEFAKILELIERDADAAFLAEHGEVLARHRGSDVYDQELVAVIRGAQAARNLTVDGIIGPQTVRGLAGESVASRVEKVKLALERLRWLPSDLTDRYVFLNAPSFRAQYFENGVEKLNMRAIYGNSGRQTYFFKDRVSYVEFHPFWGVPRSILVNTYLSRLIDDPGYLDRSGFEVTDRNGRAISSASVDWGRYGANIPYDVRQRPGPRNALGELKIMFPNRHAIYMHDTPDRHLFDRTNRAISNGCVRLEDPRAMAAAVLGWSSSDIASRLQGPHSREDLQVEVPVYLGYFTAFPDASGKVAYYDDVYSRDSRLAQAVERVERLRTPSS